MPVHQFEKFNTFYRILIAVVVSQIELPFIISSWKVAQGPEIVFGSNTVKLGYNELGYNEHSVLTNRF